jgi:hypothetical protein
VLVSDLVSAVLKDFCVEFYSEPYICYTEHGLHTLFFSRLYDALPENKRFFEWNGRKVCAIQKEYATAHALGKSKRQHWDIAVLRNPLATRKEYPYDFFEIDAAVEFGLNAGESHLREDMRRLAHPYSNVRTKFVAHFYRISEGISKRDLSPRSTRIWPGQSMKKKEDLLAEIRKTNVTVYYVLVDSTLRHQPEVLVLNRSGINRIEVDRT